MCWIVIIEPKLKSVIFKFLSRQEPEAVEDRMMQNRKLMSPIYRAYKFSRCQFQFQQTFIIIVAA